MKPGGSILTRALPLHNYPPEPTSQACRGNRQAIALGNANSDQFILAGEQHDASRTAKL